MKPNPNPHNPGPPSAKRPNPKTEGRRRIVVMRGREDGDQKTMWGAVMIGCFAVIAVFVALEVLKDSGEKPKGPSEAQLVQEKAKSSGSLMPEPTPDEAVPTVPDAATAQKQSQSQTTPDSTRPAGEETAATKEDDSEKLAAEPALLLVGPDSLRDAALTRDKEMLSRAIKDEAWDGYRSLLGKSIKEGLAKLRMGQGVNRFDPVWNEAALYQAMLRWKVIGAIQPSRIPSVVTDSYAGTMFLWLLRNNAAMEEFLLTFNSKDDGGSVLKFLTDAWSVNEEKFEKYYNLALACAVVFDRPMTIPNPVGKAEYGVESTVEPMKRYLWYVDKNEKGKLAAPVHRQPARDLVWVVCAPVTTSELEWAIDKLHYRRKNWGDAYGSIEYLMERAVEGLNPYKEYSFAEILKEGGICGDQSYFCVNTARAQGIPAMTIAGVTDLGGHAWAGVKVDDREWDTNVGRIGGASKGTAGNPQTGEAITEQEIQLWNDRNHTSTNVTLSVWRHLWISDYFAQMELDDDNAVAIKLANQLGHSFTETWKALYGLLEKQMQITGDPPAPNNLEEWKAFAKDMRREFKDNPRMAELAANAEVEYIFPYGPEGDAKRTLARERRRIERDSGEQKDLIASSLKREADLVSKRGGPDAKKDISQLYDRALRDYGGSITGFRMMAEDYFGFMKDDPKLGPKAVRDIELAFKRVVETGTKDWFRANAESGLYRMICDYYRQVGDTDRADMLEKRIDVLLRRSKRGAI